MANHARNIPCRKTDVSDATRLAQLAVHGLLRESFVPSVSAPVRELRHLARARATAVGDRTREDLRVEKMLESLGIKLSGSVASLTGVSSRAVLDAMIDGERDPQVHAQYAQRRIRSRIAELVEALTGRFTHHHAFLTQLYRDEIDMHTRTVDPLTERIEAAIKPFESARGAFARIPSLSASAAEVIIAQTSADMTVFPDAAHLASWAEGCPPAAESAGPIKSAKTMPGNKYLKGSTGYR